MKIKKGTLCLIKHSRKGTFYGTAKEDFDTEDREFYPIIVSEIMGVKGLNEEWIEGEEIPCRDSLCEIEIAKGVKDE